MNKNAVNFLANIFLVSTEFLSVRCRMYYCLLQKCKYLNPFEKVFANKSRGLPTKAKILYFPTLYKILTYLRSVFDLNEADFLQKQSVQTIT